MEAKETIISGLRAYIEPERKDVLQRFFKTGKGQYGEGDQFMGIIVPNIRKVAKSNLDMPLDAIGTLLDSPWHEVRMCGLMIMVENVQASRKKAWIKFHSLAEAEKLQKDYFDFYLNRTDRINNWDLVDMTAPAVVGDYLMYKDRNILYRLADSKLLWDQRISIISTFAFIKNGDLYDTFSIAEKLLNHEHDLIQKAVGWMLREAGKRDEKRLMSFLNKKAALMPRTMLRYSIEKFDDTTRKMYLEMKNQSPQYCPIK